MEDPENLEPIYFTDYFGNRIRLGQIGLYRSYEPNDTIGMSKSCAMDIAEEQIQILTIDTQPFNSWYNNRHKFFTLYTAVHIYLYSLEYDTAKLVKDWFRELYIMKTTEYEYR
jgi:hypothetical protein